LKRSFRTKLRQIWIPKEFRLPEPQFTKEQLDLLEELIQMIGPKISRAASATKDERAKMVDFLVDLGTGIWRVRRKIDGLSRMPREIRDALYSLESMWVAMSADGVEIADHIGTNPSNREAKVVEVREIQGLTREQVVDAIKPTIILKGEIVQMGEVIVGRPPHAAVKTAAPASVPPEQDDAIPVPVHEVETITMAPPLLKWSPNGEKTVSPEEKAQDAAALPRSMPEPPPEEIEPDAKREEAAENEPMLDPETAAMIEAEEARRAAVEGASSPNDEKTETPGEKGPDETALSRPMPEASSHNAAGEVLHEEALSVGEANVEPSAPKKRTRRVKTAAAATGESDGTGGEKPAEPKKTRASAPRKPRKKKAEAPNDNNVTPKEEA
jgi:hypothetical protein